eukprot:1046009-Rhodomonas_salina.1
MSSSCCVNADLRPSITLSTTSPSMILCAACASAQAQLSRTRLRASRGVRVCAPRNEACESKVCKHN